MTEPQLTIENVDKIYGSGESGVRAVENLSMDVDTGEIVALLGSSGCGKTSTLRMVAGFEEVSAGSISINGRPVHQLAPVRRNVAMAFEGYSLYPPLTVRDNIGFALKSARLPKAEINNRVAHIAQLLEIENILDRYPASISGGQQQRASLGRALIREADLHLLDEPMGQLEPQLRAVLRGRIKHFIKERGLTAILVTHDQTEANALADRIAVMEAGLLQQFDTASALKTRPANLFTGTFIGEPPMNVFNATVKMEGDQVNLQLGNNVTLAYQQHDFSAAVLARINHLDQLLVGVRPYAIKRSEAGAQATVVANQWLGDQTHISTLFADGTMVLVEHDRVRLNKGDSLFVTIDADDLHLFDADTSVAIAHGREVVG
ncbi:ABC transporter ATP-binding protein [Chromatiales bacterium (ex Bugula neritina AB1)]|nr:ABC transporter ATP-binding protein [Chromatiales bacterium (ex Bugula neritina AB1)]